MNNEELYKRILNKVCIHFGFDVAHDLEYLFLVKEQEIDRLNNIINELEKYLEDKWLEWKDSCSDGIVAMANEDKAILNRIKELKEGKYYEK